MHNPAKLHICGYIPYMQLHTITRERCSSMKRFTEKVFALVKRIRASGMQISDEEVAGVLFCGINQDDYAIQSDKWT